MSFAGLRAFALGLPGATEDVKWGNDWVASVAGKMFMAAGPEPGVWKAVSFKVDEHRFLELTSLPGVVPAPYAARYHWVMVKEPQALPGAELKALVRRSHALVVAKLSKKLQKELAA